MALLFAAGQPLCPGQNTQHPRTSTRRPRSGPSGVAHWRRARSLRATEPSQEPSSDEEPSREEEPEEDDPVARLLAERSAERYEKILAAFGKGEDDGTVASLLEELRRDGVLDDLQKRQDRALRIMQGLEDDDDDDGESETRRRASRRKPSKKATRRRSAAADEDDAAERDEDVDDDADEGDEDDNWWDREPPRRRGSRRGRGSGARRFLESLERRASALLDEAQSDNGEARDMAERTGWAVSGVIALYFALQLLLALISFFAKFTFSFVAIFVLSAGIFIVFYLFRF